MRGYKTKKDKQTPRDHSFESEYESDGGMLYSPLRALGKGENAEGRLFKSPTGKTVVVLNPVKIPGDMQEARVKHRFFQMVYPDRQSHLFTKDKDYRLVIPYIPYTPYEELPIDSQAFLMVLFRSAIKALKHCHGKGIIIVDLKLDNIYYDSTTQKSYLIDGGLSALTGTPIDPQAFQQVSQKVVERYRTEYEHIPPECWSVEPATVLATPEMDIYSLGMLISDLSELLDVPDIKLQLLIDSCLARDPRRRPTLMDLKNSLIEMEQEAPAAAATAAAVGAAKK